MQISSYLEEIDFINKVSSTYTQAENFRPVVGETLVGMLSADLGIRKNQRLETLKKAVNELGKEGKLTKETHLSLLVEIKRLDRIITRFNSPYNFQDKQNMLEHLKEYKLV